MTELDQQITIAEACGWTSRTFRRDNRTRSLVTVWYDKKYSSLERQLPDYLHDLNAMHEAEKTLRRDNNRLLPEQGEESDYDHYLWELEQVVASTCAEEDIYSFVVSAAAAQRAQAFLRTLNLWKD